MEREMSPALAKIYIDFAAQEEANRTRRLEEAEREKRVGELFKQGINILDVYGNDIVKFSDGRIIIITPHVTLENGDKKVSFTIKGVKRKADSHKLPLSDSYESVSINITREANSYFEIDNSALFSFTASRTGLVTPMKKNNNPDAIQATSDLLNAMQQSLSETHTPRSQQVKPETGGTRLLVNIFRHLKPAGKL